MLDKGLFISFEGLDCSGKSTIIKLLSNYLLAKNHDIVVTREPGGFNSNFCEAIRNLLLDNNNDINDITEALLFAASRSEHVEKVIVPELNNAKIVISDRFIDSSLVYQGYAKKLGIDKIYKINSLAIKNVLPKITFYLKISPETYMNRMKIREGLDRCDLASMNLKQQIIEGYEIIAKKYSDRIITIDANNDITKVFNDIIDILSERFGI